MPSKLTGEATAPAALLQVVRSRIPRFVRALAVVRLRAQYVSKIGYRTPRRSPIFKIHRAQVLQRLEIIGLQSHGRF